MSSWQPIETAPRDGTRILVWDRFRRAAVIAQWSTGGGCWDTDDETERDSNGVPHWMPLPEPPAA